MPDSIKDELIAAQNANAAAGSAGTAAASSVAESGSMSMPAYADPERAQAINRMYDANINAQRANLQSAYDQNLSTLEANREGIAQRYQQARNTAATDYERQRRNFNEQAMMNGLGTGTGSQAALAQNAAYQRQQGAINAAEGTDVSNLERSIADLKVRYQNDINSAVANNDYKRAAALLDEYNAAYSRAQQEAQLKAQYGDFSGYSTLYGADTAKQMQDVWARQNPGIAYSMGYIDANAYHQITGKYPAGYSTGRSYYPASGGNQGGGGGNGDGDGTDLLDQLPGGGDGVTPITPTTGEAVPGGNSALQSQLNAQQGRSRRFGVAAPPDSSNPDIYNWSVPENNVPMLGSASFATNNPTARQRQTAAENAILENFTNWAINNGYTN